MSKTTEKLKVTSHEIDVSVGNKIRIRRKTLDVSQKDLAKKIGVTFQQLQKYEKASNRISAGRLCQIARALHTDINFFFPEKNEKPLFNKQEICLLKLFKKISDDKLQEQVLSLVSKMAKISIKID